HGADSAFAAGIPAEQRTVWLPWPNYNELSGPDCRVPSPERMQECLAIAERLHPAWHRCSQGARKLHARNVAILLGPELDRPVDAVVCWTQGGAVAGGTGMALRIAAERRIPVFNLGSMTVQTAREQLEQIRRSLGPTDARAAARPAHRTGLDPESKTRVVHIRNAPPDAIRIDRKTPWGNPFIIGRDGTREEVIAKHRDDLWKRIHAGTVDLAELASLHGKTLACHCAPKACHGDTLAEAAAWAVANRHQATATDPSRAAVSSQVPVSQDTASRTYVARDACVFRFTKADWGLFSNFAPLPNAITAADKTWPTSEHLYQAAKFRLSPDVQEQIAQAALPRDAAKLGRDRANKPDADWTSRRTDAMRWVIRMKREANPELVDSALERSGDRPIVEYSGHDAFWGAKPDGANLVGSNVLGRLWMELRQQIRDGDPSARASAWENPLTPAAVTSTDPARDERSHINQTYRDLLAASGNDPHLIPYQDNFDSFRATVSGAIDADRQPAQYMEKLRELDRRLQADSERKETLASIQRETTDLDAQLSWLTRTACSAGDGSIADLTEYPAFVQDATRCLERWTAFQADPEARAHIEHLDDPVLDTRVYLLSGHVPVPEPAMIPGRTDHQDISPPSQHPIVREYVQLLEQAGNKPELLVYQPAFHGFRETVRLARDDPSQHPEMAAALGRLSAKLEQSHDARATVASLRRRLTESADEARNIENWAAGQGSRTIQNSPRYDAWRTNADALVDEYRSMTRDSSLAPHVNDRDEARQFLQRRIAFLSEDRFARTPAHSTSEEEALHLSRAQEADQGISMSM
ncbi:MAG: NADAR domain-containing protein, partial [Alphaproteobacteria bacterium]|nr:NADAR domain-containing protein [Alphaproteobacteria bacterium]